MFKRIIEIGLKNALFLSLTTTTAILAVTLLERDDAWGAINNVCHIVDGDDTVYGDSFNPRDSSLGIALNATAMGIWALIYEALFGRIKFPKSIATSAGMTAAAYLTDYYVVPKQFTPGIENKISKKSIAIVYAVLAISFFITSLQSKRKTD